MHFGGNQVFQYCPLPHKHFRLCTLYLLEPLYALLTFPLDYEVGLLIQCHYLIAYLPEVLEARAASEGKAEFPALSSVCKHVLLAG